MTAARLLLVLAVAAVSTAAQAQSRPPYVGPGVDPQRYQADQHRYEIDRLRAQADQRDAFAGQLQLESRLTRLEIEAARQPAIVPEPSPRALRSPEQERALRETAARRRQSTTAGVAQIDAWLDRPAN